MGALYVSMDRGACNGSAWLLIGLTVPGCFTVVAAGPIGKSRGTSSASIVLARKIGVGRSSRVAGTTPEESPAAPRGIGRLRMIEEFAAGATRWNAGVAPAGR